MSPQPAPKFPPQDFASADYWKTARLEQMRKVITGGKPGTAMAAFGQALSPEQIDDVLEYLKTFAAK